MDWDYVSYINMRIWYPTINSVCIKLWFSGNFSSTNVITIIDIFNTIKHSNHTAKDNIYMATDLKKKDTHIKTSLQAS